MLVFLQFGNRALVFNRSIVDDVRSIKNMFCNSGANKNQEGTRRNY